MARASDHDPDETEDPSERMGRDLLDDTPDERAGGLPELLRRVMTMGFSGLFTTEAAIRGALGDTLPREWVDFIAEQSERTRNEFITRLTHEFAHVLESVDVVDLAEQLLEGRTVEVKAEIRLRPRESEPRGRRGLGRRPSTAADAEPSSPGETRSSGDTGSEAGLPGGGGRPGRT